ncbi:MAG: hypothetical protein HYS25_04760 [Ignavibacteriales bacterium]|nr:hypothetical protein [Ignavibacteriales bacterium]
MKEKYGYVIISIEQLINKKSLHLYTLIVYKDKDNSIICKKGIIFSEKKKMIPVILEKYIRGTSKKKDIILYEQYSIDTTRIIKMIQNNSIDFKADIINAINMLDDLRISMKIKIDLKYQKLLDDFANHLTFHRRYGRYFDENNVVRNEIIEAFCLLIEEIFNHSKILTSNCKLFSYEKYLKEF